MLSYWKKVQDKGGKVYSVDMLRLSLELRQDAINDINLFLANAERSDIKEYPQNLTSFKYRYLFTIDYGSSSMSIGLVFNGTKKEENYKGFIEFNPNKCITSDTCQCVKDLRFLIGCCVSADVVRYDLAVDIPLSRSCVHLLRGRKHYSVEMNDNEDKTEYLGQRNKVGRVKCYNKQKESDLDYPLTRLELTLGKPSEWQKDIELNYPDVFYIDPQKSIDMSDLNSTNKVLLELLLDSPDINYYYMRLDKYMKKKLEPFVLGDTSRLKVDNNCVRTIIDYINDLVN